MKIRLSNLSASVGRLSENCFTRSQHYGVSARIDLSDRNRRRCDHHCTGSLVFSRRREYRLSHGEEQCGQLKASGYNILERAISVIVFPSISRHRGGVASRALHDPVASSTV